MAGELYFHHGGERPGWVYPAIRAKPNEAPPYRWTNCPFCDGTLPSILRAVEKLMRQEAAWQRLLQEIRHQERLPDWLRKVEPKDWLNQADGEGDDDGN
jgi:hypothetical protein